MHIHSITARDLPDLWFQAVHDILYSGRRFTVDKGSYEGQTRLEYDYFIGHVKFPGTLPILPDIPPALGIPNPVDEAYIYGGEGYSRSYIEYMMSGRKEPGEAYTYGERLSRSPMLHDDAGWTELAAKVHESKTGRPGNRMLFEENDKILINQIEWIIEMYRTFGDRNNQMVLQIAKPDDIVLDDPPCLRHIDTRIQDDRLHFFVYFRSWDLWSGLPANLAAIQHLKEYMAAEIGVKDGEMIVESKGLHIYGYAEELAKIRCMVAPQKKEGWDMDAGMPAKYIKDIKKNLADKFGLKL
jgi:thymidylate synthase